MRERLTAAFVVLAIAVLLGAGAARAYTLRDLLRDEESGHLRQDVVLIEQVVAGRVEAGQPVDRKLLTSLVSDETRLEFVGADGRALAVTGDAYAGGADDLTVTRTTDVGTITLQRDDKSLGEMVGRDRSMLAALFALVVISAALAGWLAARALASPFRKLAVAASALGRGRFDLDLPRTRIPEAQAIANSLRASALQLESRLSREGAFAEHASHVLRTPLTVLRLELEELTLRGDVPDDAKAAAVRCIASVDSVTTSAGELVDMTRRASLVEGAELTLQELATQLAQRWADRLAEERRKLTASVEGDLQLPFTPGPVEHVLDLVLSDIVVGGRGPVDITFFGQEGHLRVRMPAGVIAQGGTRRRRGPQPGTGLAEATTLVKAQGGRVSGDGVEQDLEILLPRR